MKISMEIEKIAKNNAVHIERLTKEKAVIVKNSIIEKYTCSCKRIFLWDSFKEAAVLQDSNGWQKLCSFIGNKECLMFFDDGEDEAILCISNGEDLYILLYEMFGFEFYITNIMTEYLICFNHHDCLLGCGLAKKLLESLIE